MRIGFGILYSFLVIALIICAVRSGKSNRPIKNAIALMLVGLIPPVLGNMLIILSSNKTIATTGCYIYFLGMDLAVFALIRFTFEYCNISWRYKWSKVLVYGLLVIDAVQLLLNPIFGQAFTTEPVMVQGSYYYSLVPLAGQTFHRIVDYGVFAASIIIFIAKIIKAPRIDVERYGVILFAMAVTGLWQTFYIFSRTPVDRSMIGFGVFGLLIYFFALQYKPVRLLDHMLASVASGLPDALFFFDADGQCIWLNEPAKRLTGISDERGKVTGRLLELFGEWRQKTDVWKDQYNYTHEGKEKTCIIERHKVTDDKGRLAGRFLRIRDNTEEQQTLQREIYHSTHDKLTGVYNRTGYDLIMGNTEQKISCMIIMDIDYFKEVNDTHGHTTGDLVLKKVTEIIKRHFRSDDSICRIGGDEFVVLMADAADQIDNLIGNKVESINLELKKTDDGLPAVSVSAGVAHGRDANDRKELFEQADKALYTAKENGRRRCEFFRDMTGDFS